MKNIILSALMFLSIVSCNNEPPEQDTLVKLPNATVSSADSSGSSMILNSNSTQPNVLSKTNAQSSTVKQEMTIGALNKIQPLQNNSTVKAGAGLNPSHGQPGHRCDISVGAPLNSTATKPQAPATNMVQAAKIPQQITAGKTIASMNPAHGQPGHRCDISVGAPLNSAATKPSVPGATISQPAIIPQPSAASNLTAGVNPPHGQPGHDCKVAVGQPLK